MMQDVRFAWRVARQNAGSTVAAFVALTIGIGSTTAMLSVINGVLLRPLPVKQPSEIVNVYQSNATERHGLVSMPNYLDWKKQVAALDEWALFSITQANLTGSGEPRRVRIVAAEASLMPLLGVRPVLGRNFTSEENKPGHDDVVLLGYALWKGYFGARQNVLGQTVYLDDHPKTVIGVLPEGIYSLSRGDLWTPVALDLKAAINVRAIPWYNVLGRLQPQATLPELNSQLTYAARVLADAYPKDNADVGAGAITLSEWMHGDVRFALVVVFCAVSCVLAIACADVANLLLVRASSRRREISIRLAMGASRWHIIRQLLTESVLLSFSAAIAGGALAVAVIHILQTSESSGIAYPEQITLNGRVLLLTAAIGIASGILFGLAPAIEITRSAKINDTLKQTTGRVTETRVQRNLRLFLIGSETAFATALLIASGLFIRSFIKVSEIKPGFNPANILTADVSLPLSRYRPTGAEQHFIDAVLDRTREIPGLRSAAFTSKLPFLGEMDETLLVEGRPVPKHHWDASLLQATKVSARYFETMEIPVIKGRTFDRRDGVNQTPSAIINETLAKQYFANEDPIGKRVAFYLEPTNWRQIVGIVGDVRQTAQTRRTMAEIYTPLQQEETAWITLVIRTKSDPEAYASATRSVIRQVDPLLAVFDVDSMKTIMKRELGWREFHSYLLTLFAAIAILLASVGIYAVVAYTVTLRKAEIGVRMAIGAEPFHIQRMIARQGLLPSIAGIAVGIIASLFVSQHFAHFLYSISAFDLPTYFGVSALLLIVAAFASFVPASRASAIDPSLALRNE